MAILDDIKLRRKMVRETLKLLHSLSSQRVGESDFRASVIFMDFKNAFMESDLSKRELDVIHYIYVEDMDRKEVAQAMDVSLATVYRIEERAIEEVARHMKGV